MVQRRKSLRSTALAFTVLATVVPGLGPVAASDAAAAMTVSPATGLVDRQVVAVDISRVAIDVSTVFECRTGATELRECDDSDINGSLPPNAQQASLRLDAVFRRDDGPG